MNSSPKKSEAEKLLDHDYDGIQELDNPLPSWWVYMFYATIIFSALYWAYYSFGGGPKLTDELAIEMQAIAAHEASEKQLKETNDIAIDYSLTPENIAAGKLAFDGRCIACHGPDGGGLIGPNLTDNFWKNGDGSAEAIANVIAKGVPEKGMLAWEALLSPADLTNVTIYVKSLAGSQPSNPKAPEGSPIE